MSRALISSAGVVTVMGMTVVFQINTFVVLAAGGIMVSEQAPGEVTAKTAVNEDACHSFKNSLITRLNRVATSHGVCPNDLQLTRHTQVPRFAARQAFCAARNSVPETDRTIHEFLRFGMSVRFKLVPATVTAAMIIPLLCLLPVF